MRKYFVWAAAAAMLCGSVWADVCSDLKTQYSSLILRLQQETNAALSQTTDPAEQTAIRESYQAQLAALEAERDATLAASGCTSTTDPGTTTPPPTTGGTDPGTGGTDPGTGGTDPGTGVGGTPGDGGNGSQTCTDLMNQVRADAKTIAATKGRGAAAQYVRSKKPEIESVCGNYGRGRCQVGGMGHDDHNKCDRDDDHKPAPKCDPKPKCDTHKKCDR